MAKYVRYIDAAEAFEKDLIALLNKHNAFISTDTEELNSTNGEAVAVLKDFDNAFIAIEDIELKN
jgi:hypothetical protein